MTRRRRQLGCECNGMGSYGAIPPLAYAGWRLSLPGSPRGGQYHGYLGNASPWDFANPGSYSPAGIFRSPGEVPPSANANKVTNIVSEPHAVQRVGQAEVPGALGMMPMYRMDDADIVRLPNRVSPVPPIVARPPITPPVVISPTPHPIPFPVPARTPVVTQPPTTTIPTTGTGATSKVTQPPPASPAPTSMVCDQGSMYKDAAGNWTCDWHNPYSLYLPQPSPVVAADTSTTPTAGQTTAVPASWFTDPAQELISGIPNWGLVAAAGVGLMLLMRGKR